MMEITQIKKLKIENKKLGIGFIITLVVIFMTLLSFGWRILIQKRGLPKKEGPIEVINGEFHKDYQRCASEDPIRKDNCYKLSAIANNDISICSFIEDTSTTRFRRKDCILITEAVNSSVLPLICEGLDEGSCSEQEGCSPIYDAPNVECPSNQPNCVEKSYSHCSVNAQFFCTKSGGSLDKRYECVCSEGEAVIKPYGCFSCNDFSVPEAKQECLRRSKPKKDDSEKKTLLMFLESRCKGKHDGNLRRYIREELDSVNDLITVFIHSKNKPTVSQVLELEKLGVIPYLEQTWIPPLESHPTGFFVAKTPAKKLPDVCSLQFVERLASAEEEYVPQFGPD